MLAWLAASGGAGGADGPFDHQAIELGAGLWLLQRPDPIRQPVEGNITVIAGADGLLVVDTGGSTQSGRDAVGLIRGLSDLPVRYIVNTHWHGDHHLGNAAFREAWPTVQIIAHVNTARDMTGEAMNYLEGQDTAIEQALEQIAGLLEAGTDPAGSPLDDAQRQRYLKLQSDAEQILEAAREFRLVGANRTFQRRLELDLGGRTVRVLHPGRGNTEGDAVVFLPADRVLISGDLVVAPTPYGFHSYPAEWIDSLAVLRGMDWDILIPGHGDPLHDRDYLDLLSVMITSMRAQASAAVAEGLDLAAFRERLDLATFAARIAGEDDQMQRLFQAWWVEPFSQSAWLEASGLPIIQGDDE